MGANADRWVSKKQAGPTGRSDSERSVLVRICTKDYQEHVIGNRRHSPRWRLRGDEYCIEIREREKKPKRCLVPEKNLCAENLRRQLLAKEEKRL